MYKVSVGAKRLQFTPLQSSLQKEDQIKIEVQEEAEHIEALDLEHPVIKWTDKLKRRFTASDTDTNNKLVRTSGILMGRNDTPTPRDFPPVLEENHIQCEVGKSNYSENIDDPVINECPEPPKMKDDFTPHQLKAKCWRSSSPNRFEMEDRQSIVLHTRDEQSDLEKLKSVIKKLQQIHAKVELEFLYRVCRRDLMIPEQSPEGIPKGRPFVHKFFGHYRTDREPSLGDKRIINQTLSDAEHPAGLEELPPELSGEECHHTLPGATHAEASKMEGIIPEKEDPLEHVVSEPPLEMWKRYGSSIEEALQETKLENRSQLGSRKSRLFNNFSINGDESSNANDSMDRGRYNKDTKLPIIRNIDQDGEPSVTIMNQEIPYTLTKRDGKILKLILEFLKPMLNGGTSKASKTRSTPYAVLGRFMMWHGGFFTTVAQLMIPHPCTLKNWCIRFKSCSIKGYFNADGRKTMQRMFFHQDPWRLSEAWVDLFANLSLDWRKVKTNPAVEILEKMLEEGHDLGQPEAY